MSDFRCKRFLSVLMGALTVLGSSVASAGNKRLGRDTKVSSARRARKKIGEGNGKGRKRRRLKADLKVKGVNGLGNVLKETDGKVVGVSSDGEGGFLVFIKKQSTGVIVTVSVVGVAFFALVSYLTYFALSGNKKTDGSGQEPNPEEEPKDDPNKLEEEPKDDPSKQKNLNEPKVEVVPNSPACFCELSEDERCRFGDVVSSFGFNSDFAFIEAAKSVLCCGNGKFDSKWGKFSVQDGSILGSDGKKAVIKGEGYCVNVSSLSKLVSGLVGNLDFNDYIDVFACLLTTLFVYAKCGTTVFELSFESTYVADKHKLESVKSAVVNTYNEIKEWVKSCLKKKV